MVEGPTFSAARVVSTTGITPKSRFLIRAVPIPLTEPQSGDSRLLSALGSCQTSQAATKGTDPAFARITRHTVARPKLIRNRPDALFYFGSICHSDRQDCHSDLSIYHSDPSICHSDPSGEGEESHDIWTSPTPDSSSLRSSKWQTAETGQSIAVGQTGRQARHMRIEPNVGN